MAIPGFERIRAELEALRDPRRKKKKIPRRGQTVPQPQAKPQPVHRPAPEAQKLPPTPQEDVQQAVPQAEEVFSVTDLYPDAQKLSGQYMQIRLDRSFKARLYQSDEELNGYYQMIRKAFFAYAGVTSHISWKGELFRCGRKKIGALRIRGKSLILFLALDPEREELEQYRFRGESVKDLRTLSDLPFCYEINGERRCRWGTELIDLLAKDLSMDAAKKEKNPEDERPDNTDTATLIDEMLIKEIVYLYDEPPRGWANLKKAGEGMETDGISFYRTTQLFRNYASVSLADLEKNFKAGQAVTLPALLEKGLVPEETDAYRLIGSKGLTKPLTVLANYCALHTAEAVIKAGGVVYVCKSAADYAGDSGE
ncbi:MAG: uL15 family ribosomal protein [Clostridia bacterium]|nr:uL15 family ribosomal protein [Clostridia bacterium]